MSPRQDRRQGGLFDVRTNTATTAGYDSVARFAATPLGTPPTLVPSRTKKHDDWDDPCFAMGYDFVSHETGGHLAEETDKFFQQLVNHAGGGDLSDKARFRHIEFIGKVEEAWILDSNVRSTADCPASRSRL